MKATLRHWIYSILATLAKWKLQQIQPHVVSITGSAGKTSAKEAIAAVLEQKLSIKKSEKNMNSEFGVALTILDQKSAYGSVLGWLGVIFGAFFKVLKTETPYDVLVMELGVDKPGDMDELLNVIHPDVAVFLNVKNVHRAEGQFPNRQAIFDEKAKMCRALTKDGWAVLNMDDNFVRQLEGSLAGSVVKIGSTEDCDLRARDVQSTRKGLEFILNYEDKTFPVHLPHVLGACHVNLILAAIAVGFIEGLNWPEIEKGLRNFSLPPGRMNPIEGKQGSLIIDSSYNAAPETMEAALDVLDLFSGRKIAALGTMNELGELSESAHLSIGKRAAEVADMLIAVGDHANELALGAQQAGLPLSMIHQFRNSKEAGEFLAEILGPRDVVLAKGSQNHVRMERLVKLCMQEPEQARHQLVRQEPYWLTHL